MLTGSTKTQEIKPGFSRSRAFNILLSTWARLRFGLPQAIILLAVSAHILPGPRTIDDAYITFRYARNILAGSGFVFNPGEHVLGTTTPIYTILLTVFGLFTGGVHAPFPHIALFVNALAAAGACLILIKLGRRLGSTPAGLAAALVWVIAPYSVTFAIGGLETSFYVFLLLATIYAFIVRRNLLTALLAALAILTRPDALILIGPLALTRLIEIGRDFYLTIRGSTSRQKSSSKIPLRSFLTEIAIFLSPLLSWSAFATIYFGSPLPHSIAAKSLAYRLPATAATIRLLQHYATPFLEQNIFGMPWIIVGLILYPFLYLIGFRAIYSKVGRSVALLVYPWFYFLTFAIANPLIFRWYLTPPLPIYILVILVGAHKILGDLLSPGRSSTATRTSRSRFVYSFSVLALILLPFASSLSEWRLTPDHGLTRPAPEMSWYRLELLYAQAADYLQPELDGNSVIAAGDVGVIGFRTDAPILDTVGLNSRQAVDYYPLNPEYYSINYAVPPELILDEKPEFIVMLEAYIRNGLLKSDEFHSTYQLIKKIPTDIYGSDGMLIFSRIPGK